MLFANQRHASHIIPRGREPDRVHQVSGFGGIFRMQIFKLYRPVGSHHGQPNLYSTARRPLVKQQKQLTDVCSGRTTTLAVETLGCDISLLPALGFLYFSRTPVKREAPAGVCDPFAKPGALYLNLVNTTSTIWTPFDETCRPSHLLPLVKQVLDADAMCVTSFILQLFQT